MSIIPPNGNLAFPTLTIMDGRGLTPVAAILACLITDPFSSD